MELVLFNVRRHIRRRWNLVRLYGDIQMKKRALKYKDETLLKALKQVSNPYDMVCFLFTYRAKELLLAIIIILLIVIWYPDIVNIVKRIF